MTDMTKRRDELASEWGDGADQAFIKGWNEGQAEMQAQIDELKKSNNEMSDLIYSEDGYIASQDELNNEIRKWRELYQRTEKYGDKVTDERDTLKQQLEIAVKALKIVSFLKGKVHWVAPNNRDELRTLLENGEQALTSINEILNKTKQGE